MRISPSRHLFLSALIALALFATACGSSTATDTAVSSGEETSAEPSEPSEPVSDSSTATGEESPIADLLGIPIGDSGEMDDYFADLGRQAEVKIAECMLSQGFEYSVVDYGDLGGVTIDDDGDREYAEEYGFGITSNPFEESFEAFEQFDDPNQDYVASLGEGEQAAYYSALFGDDAFDANSEETAVFQPSGCQGDAFEEVFAFGQIFDQFGNQFAEIEAAYEADPRIVSATSGWSECMTAAGYRYTDEDGASSDIRRRYRAIVDDPDAREIPEGLEGVESGEVIFESAGDGDDTFFFGNETLKPEYQQRVDALGVEERAVAVASWDCNGPLREIEDDVRLEYEQKFVDENGAAIEAALEN